MTEAPSSPEFPAPTKARLVYDGDCGFCRYTVDYARSVTGKRVDYLPYQDVAAEYADLDADDFRASIRLFEDDPAGSGSHTSGAEAAFRTLALGGRRGWLLVYRHLPGMAAIAEAAYRFVARHRAACLAIARPLFGRRLEAARFDRTADLVCRGIALMGILAFGSLWLQAGALIGPDGVLPARDFLYAVRDTLGWRGYWRVPTVLWFGMSMHLVFGFGVLCCLVALAGRLRTTAALGACIAWLSLVGVGQTFTSFQWDTLLVECLFAAAILARSPVAGIWVMRLLVFRFMFLSGAVKLLSGDPTWADLTALEYHFETQPLPTVLAWYAHHLTDGLLTGAVVATFAIELAVPFLIFAPRNLRAAAAAAFLALELLIGLTGSYNFFNLLTIVMCVALLDDGHLRAMSPRRLAGKLVPRADAAVQNPRRAGAACLAAAIIALGMCQTAAPFGRFPNPAVLVDPLRIVNRYGLFAVMTRERRELVIEGSMDGETWHAYEFPFKPGEPDRPPRLATPHQPRLDWQMWFAALTTIDRAPWVYSFMYRLFEAEPAVLEWVEDPFDGEAPAYLRIVSWRYRFTAPEVAGVPATPNAGRWWTRSDPRPWFGPVRHRVATVPDEPPPE